MNSKFIGSQTNLNPIEMDRPDYRYGFTDLGINFQSSVGNKYFPHCIFVGEDSVSNGVRKQMKLEKMDNVGADIRATSGDRIVIKQDGTYVVQIIAQYTYSGSVDASKVCAIGIEYVINGTTGIRSYAKRSASNPDMITDTEFVSLEKGNQIGVLQTHTYSGTQNGKAIVSIMKLS